MRQSDTWLVFLAGALPALPTSLFDTIRQINTLPGWAATSSTRLLALEARRVALEQLVRFLHNYFPLLTTVENRMENSDSSPVAR